MKDNQRSSDTPDDMKRWLQGLSSTHRDQIERTWSLSARAAQAPPSDQHTEAELRRMRSRLHRNSGPPRGEPSGDRPPSRGAFRSRGRALWVSVVGFLLLVSIAWAIAPVTVTVPRGETLAVTLPDGSEAELSGGSTLTHARYFVWGDRTVQLRGEGFFDVRTTSRPFVVETHNATVSVLGTQFNVRSWRGDTQPGTDVIVTEGRVAVRARAGAGKAVEVAANQMSRVDGPRGVPTSPTDVDATDRLAWRRGGISYVNQPVVDVLSDLERRFGLEIHLEGPVSPTRRLTLYRSNVKSGREVVEDVCAYLQLTCTTNGSAVRLAPSTDPSTEPSTDPSTDPSTEPSPVEP